VLFCVLFACKCVLPPGDNLTAVNKYININKHFERPRHKGEDNVKKYQDKVLFRMKWTYLDQLRLQWWSVVYLCIS
jgi:hypothetical protein